MNRSRFVVAACTLVALVPAHPSKALADSIAFELNNIFSGTASPGCTGPSGSCLTATFSDGGGTGSVTLLLAAHLLPGQFISQFYFNTDPDITAQQFSNLSVAYQDGPSTDTPDGAPNNPTVTKSLNNLKAGGTGGDFDVRLNFATAGNNGGAFRFTGTESSIWLLALSGINASDFGFASVADLYGAIHLQGIVCSSQPCTGTNSVWMADTPEPVPLPAALPLFAGGLGVMAWMAKRKKRMAAAEA